MFLNNFFIKCEQICRYLQIMVIHVWRNFFLFGFLHAGCELYKCEVRDFFCRLIAKAEFKNPFEYKYRDEMENRCAYVVIFYFCFNFFLLKWDFLWKSFVSQNVMINIFLPTRPAKKSDWRFASQIGYGGRP